MIQNREQLFRQGTSTSNQLQQYSVGGIPIPDHLVTSRSRRSLLLSVVWAIYGCYYAGTWRFDRSSYVPNDFVFDAPGTNCIDSS